MSQGMFKVKPVQHYDKPRYLSASEEESAEASGREEERTHPVTLLLSFLLVAIVIFGLVGCYMRSEYRSMDPPDDPPDGDPPDPPDCDEGAIRCADDWTLAVCVDETWDSQSCDDYCFEEYGYDYYSMGCNAEADDPCQCEYGMLDGVAAECTPDEVRCVDEWTLEHCEDWWPEVQTCHDWCQEHYGFEYTSWGCDEEAEEICQCDYDMVDGGIAECFPEDVYCVDEDTVTYCDPGSGVFHELNCIDYCVEVYGEGATSDDTCSDDEIGNPCGCAPGVDSGSGSGD